MSNTSNTSNKSNIVDISKLKNDTIIPSIIFIVPYRERRRVKTIPQRNRKYNEKI